MKFCRVCDTILNTRFIDNKISFICAQCRTEEDAKPEDSLIHDDSNTTLQALLVPYSQHAKKDITNNRVYRECHKCKYPIMQQLIIGPNCDIIYVCVGDGCDYIEKRVTYDQTAVFGSRESSFTNDG